MENGSQEFAKYSTFKHMAMVYNDLAERAKCLIKEGFFYKISTDNMKGSMDTAWPIQKEIMDLVLVKTDVSCGGKYLISILRWKE